MRERISEIAVATRNNKKMDEIRRMLEGSGITPLSLDEADPKGQCPEVVEDAPDFRGNALKKAREASRCTGRAALADDSGLVVDALGGAPGVHSARYAGPRATDADNNSKLLLELAGQPPADRSARFVCVLALVMPAGSAGSDRSDRQEMFFEGTVEGHIAGEPQGENGFGYDPLFVPTGHTRSFAEMTEQEKDSMSHRGRALKAFADWAH